MASVRITTDVDIDLDEIDLDELIEEVERRNAGIFMECATMMDKMKLDHLARVLSNYTLEQIETALP